jgi:hypothetical protein
LEELIMRKQKFVVMAGLSALVAGAGLMAVAHLAVADDAGNANVLSTVPCMQDTAGFGLNCSANDVQLAAATNIVILDDGCAFLGDEVTFAADFEVVLTAQARHDIGIWFAQDGDPNGDGAITGTCTAATPAYGPDPPWLDLDGTSDPFPGEHKPSGVQDTCGDIDADHNPLFPQVVLTVECIDPDGDGKLNLPNCTSWRQGGANDLCTSPDEAFPGAPSKCRCDIGFNVDIDVPQAELQVVKTATPTSVNEPGATVTFDIAVTNTGIDPNNDVTLNTLSDDIYGDITQVQGDIQSTTCSVTQTITPGGTYTCSFNATVSGNGGDSQTDTVTASGVDDNGNSISGSDDATVDILDVLPAISVVKTADPTSVLEGAGQSVTFTVVVDNDSVADPLTLTSLTDDIHGDLDGQGTCATGGTIAVGGSYNCSFTAVVDGAAFSSETDTVTAVGVDDEFVDDATTPANKVTASDSATVTILDDVAMIELIKTAHPPSVNEEGDDVTYTFTVNNLSNVDTVTIDSLTDTIYGDLNGQGTCSASIGSPQVLGPLGSYTCSVTVFVPGNAGDVVLNVATATGFDDDGKPVMASDDATVNIVDVPPAASLIKTATMVVATFDVVVTNDSTAESLDLTVLDDDQFGDITQVQGNVQSTTCAVPQNIAMGDSYTCSFDAKISTSPHTDTVTGTVSDNDGGQVTPSDSATVSFE